MVLTKEWVKKLKTVDFIDMWLFIFEIKIFNFRICQKPTFAWSGLEQVSSWWIYFNFCVGKVVINLKVPNVTNFFWATFFILYKGSFTNYIDKILAFFDHLPPCVDIFYGITIDKKWSFLDHLPTSSCKRSLWMTSNSLEFSTKNCPTPSGIEMVILHQCAVCPSQLLSLDGGRVSETLSNAFIAHCDSCQYSLHLQCNTYELWPWKWWSDPIAP